MGKKIYQKPKNIVETNRRLIGEIDNLKQQLLEAKGEIGEIHMEEWKAKQKLRNYHVFCGKLSQFVPLLEKIIKEMMKGKKPISKQMKESLRTANKYVEKIIWSWEKFENLKDLPND